MVDKYIREFHLNPGVFCPEAKWISAQARGGIAELARVMGYDADPQRIAAFHSLMVGADAQRGAGQRAIEKRLCK